jgi:uncharacterized protein (TIGR02466 family)
MSHAMPQIPKPKLKSSEVDVQFPTVLMTRIYDDVKELNTALGALINKLEKEAHNVADDTSNVGGYHSDSKLMNRSEPEIVILRDMIGGAVKEYMERYFEENCSAPPTDLKIRMWGWGINMREGDINTQHVHPDAKISGVYYPVIPPGQGGGSKSRPGGSIMFCDPRPRAHMNQVGNQITEIVVPPTPGMMVLFPSYYEHCVIPFKGPGVRTCIAFNAHF